MNVQNTLLKDLVNYRFLMFKLWHGSFFCISSCYCCWVVSGFGSVEILYIKSPCGILALWDRSFLWGGRLFPGKTYRDCRCFLPRPISSCRLPESHHYCNLVEIWGGAGELTGLKEYEFTTIFEVQKKNHTQDPPSVCGVSTFQPPNGRSVLFLGDLSGLKFQILGGFRYAWLVKIHVSDLFDWAHPSSSSPVLLTKNGPLRVVIYPRSLSQWQFDLNRVKCQSWAHVQQQKKMQNHFFESKNLSCTCILDKLHVSKLCKKYIYLYIIYVFSRICMLWSLYITCT